ncbi:hypothetical protein GCM10010266_30890 [Streptomyces griseomycini]|nr:hypothetical protein GCM10010266_30890 [Streptomyces griseomycini]GGR20736.1 hypothetical protein GCM10015536_27880 [Streptomyces griseomycini]
MLNPEFGPGASGIPADEVRAWDGPLPREARAVPRDATDGAEEAAGRTPSEPLPGPPGDDTVLVPARVRHRTPGPPRSVPPPASTRAAQSGRFRTLAACACAPL